MSSNIFGLDFTPVNDVLNSVFITKPKTSSPASADLPSNFQTDSMQYGISTTSNANFIPLQNMSPTSDSNATMKMPTNQYTNLSTTSQERPGSINTTLSPTSSMGNTMYNNNTQKNLYFSNTSSEIPKQQMNNLSETSEMTGINAINQNNFNWKNDVLYFSQIDMDIAWLDKKNDSNPLLFGDLAEFFGMESNKQPLPVVCDFKKAVDVAHKICNFSLFVNDPKQRNEFSSKEKPLPNVIMSSVEKNKYSYPIFGSIIFALKFKEEPMVIDIGSISQNQYKMINNKSNYDIVFYNSQWNDKNYGKCRAVIFNLNKIEITDIYLKTFDCAIGGAKGLALLKILNSSSNEERFQTKYTDLLEYLYKNGGHVNLKEYELQKK